MRVLTQVFRCATATSLSAWVFFSSARLMGSSDSVCQSNTPTQHQENFLTRTAHTMPHDLEKSKQEALWGLFVGDAMAMPVHWYYNPRDIKRGYGGWLTGYTAPAKRHPSSILTLSAVDGSGRTGWSSKKKAVVGNVILHDKLKYWTSGDRSTHYHQGMSAGDNTLNAMTALQTVQVIQKLDPECTLDPAALREAVLENYVRFMTTPNSHNDTYAESFHRGFFQDWSNLENPPRDGKSIVDFCNKRYTAVERSGSEDHQLAVVGALVLTVPWILHYAHRPADDCARLTVEALRLTHPVPSLMPYVDLYARTLHAVLNGQPLKEQVLSALSSKVLGGSRKREAVERLSKQARKYAPESEARLEVYQEAISWLGMACYIDGSLPSLLFIAHEFHDDFKQGVLANANCGGENVHRGAALAALLGAESANRGEGVPRDLKEGLHTTRSDLTERMKSKI